MIFAIILHWLPGGGWNGGALKFMILPMVALSLAYIASIARITRGSMIEVLHSNFIRTARAKGIPETRVMTHHVLRNSLIPVATFLGGDLGALMTGAIVTEGIFAINGVGGTLYQAILRGEAATVVSVTTVLVLVYIVANLLVDLLYAVLDPRIRYE